MSNLRLVYFPVRARAECARMILAYGGVSYKVSALLFSDIWVLRHKNPNINTEILLIVASHTRWHT